MGVLPSFDPKTFAFYQPFEMHDLWPLKTLFGVQDVTGDQWRQLMEAMSEGNTLGGDYREREEKLR